MTDDPSKKDSVSDRLESLSKRLEGIEKKEGTTTSSKVSSSMGRSYAKAAKLCSEFVASILVGLALGVGVDSLLGTRPFGLVVFLLFGAAAGFLTIARSAQREENS